MKNQRWPAIRPKFNFAWMSFLLPLFLSQACVTVNVNFPESAVQKATDDYVRDLYRTKEQAKPPGSKPSSSPAAQATHFRFPKFEFVSQASAAEPSFNLSSPKLDSIKQSMKANVGEVLEQKKAGVLAESKDGKMSIHDAAKLKPLLKKHVEELVQAENKARDSLYAEVVSSNHLPSDTLPAVKKSFARSFQAESPSGTWVESENGAWAQKP